MIKRKITDFSDVEKILFVSKQEAFDRLKNQLDSEREITALELHAKKGLIDEKLKHMTSELENVSRVVKELEKDRVEKFGELTSQLKSANEQTAALMQMTSTLREALASTKMRGQWGERMAEDVLRLAGFIENVNYLKQKSVEATGTRPDFTFLLPKNLKLNMDVFRLKTDQKVPKACQKEGLSDLSDDRGRTKRAPDRRP